MDEDLKFLVYLCLQGTEIMNGYDNYNQCIYESSLSHRMFMWRNKSFFMDDLLLYSYQNGKIDIEMRMPCDMHLCQYEPYVCLVDDNIYLSNYVTGEFLSVNIVEKSYLSYSATTNSVKNRNRRFFLKTPSGVAIFSKNSAEVMRFTKDICGIQVVRSDEEIKKFLMDNGYGFDNTKYCEADDANGIAYLVVKAGMNDIIVVFDDINLKPLNVISPEVGGALHGIAIIEDRMWIIAHKGHSIEVGYYDGNLGRFVPTCFLQGDFGYKAYLKKMNNYLGIFGANGKCALIDADNGKLVHVGEKKGNITCLESFTICGHIIMEIENKMVDYDVKKNEYGELEGMKNALSSYISFVSSK